MNFVKVLPIIFLMGCSVSKTRSEDVLKLPELKPASTAVLELSDDNICLDTKMERWYEAFHQHQELGMDMFAADQKAVEVSNETYLSCLQSLQNPDDNNGEE